MGEKKSSPPPGPPIVLVSLPPYAYFVERIAENTVKVVTLAPPGSDPHMHEASPQSIDEVMGAALWVRLHEPFEKKILSLVAHRTPSLPIVDLCEDMDEESDRHIWLSPRSAKTQVRQIAEQLSLVCPEHQTMYEKNLTSLLLDLDELDQDIASLLAPYRGKAILTSHAAFGYFCHDYNLIQLAIECEGKEPLPQHLTEILKDAEEHQVKLMFIQPQHNDKGARLVASALHIPTFTIDPYSPDYINTLRKIAQLIQTHE